MSKHIIALDISNIAGIEAFLVEPNGEHVVIGGANMAGKTSAINAIKWALQGGKERPARTVRDGAEEGTVVITFEDLVVRWVAKAKGRDRLVLETPDGAAFKSPQAKLATLFGHMLDPLAFFRATPKAQARMLAKLAGLDLDEMEAQRSAVYSERTVVNRLLKQAEAESATFGPIPDDLPDGPVDIRPIMSALSNARAEVERNRGMRDKLAELEDLLPTAEAEARDAEESKPAYLATARKVEDELVAEAESELKRAQERVDQAKARRESALKSAEERADRTIAESLADLAALKGRIDKGRETVAGLVDPDAEQLQADLTAAQEHNRLYEAGKRIADARAKVEEHRRASDALTAQLAEMDEARSAAIAAAPIPVHGFGLEDGLVTYQGRPMDVMSSAEQLRISVSLAVAEESDIRLLPIDKWTDLDDDSRAVIREIADAHDYQIITTVVGTRDPDITVEIMDGKVSKVREKKNGQAGLFEE